MLWQMLQWLRRQILLRFTPLPLPTFPVLELLPMLLLWLLHLLGLLLR
jgi:hypothetical protein